MPPSLDDRLAAGLTPAIVTDHLRARGWTDHPDDAGKAFVADDGVRYARFVRPLPPRADAAPGTAAPLDHVAVPLGAAPAAGGRASRAAVAPAAAGAALALVVSASAARDGLDLAKLAEELGV